MEPEADIPATDVADSSGNTQLLASSLCYACHTTLTSRSSRGARKVAGIGDAIHNVPLPTWVGKNLSQAGTTNRMREQIQEFLIDADVEDNEVEHIANV
jgi:cytoplasmic tRNA 2-thiolation protein 2